MTNRRRRAALTAAALTATVLAVAGLTACNNDGDPNPTATITTTTTTTTRPPTAEETAFQDAETVYRQHIALLDTIGAKPGDKELVKGLASTSTGIEKAGQEVEFMQWATKGWHLKSGEDTVVWVKPAKAQLSLDPPQVKLKACVDASKALVVDKNGKPVRKAGIDTSSLDDVTVVQQDGRWVVSRIDNSLVASC